MSRWRFFSEREAYKLVPDLMYKLDRAREYYDNPIIITSGYRTPEKNHQVNGVSNSAHLTGKAADIKAPDDTYMRARLAWALGRAGFERVFVYPRHYHVDVDNTKPSPAFGQIQYIK